MFSLNPQGGQAGNRAAAEQSACRRTSTRSCALPQRAARALPIARLTTAYPRARARRMQSRGGCKLSFRAPHRARSWCGALCSAASGGGAHLFDNSLRDRVLSANSDTAWSLPATREQVTEVACVGENCPPLSTAMVMMTPSGNAKRIIHARMVEVTAEQVRHVGMLSCDRPELRQQPPAACPEPRACLLLLLRRLFVGRTLTHGRSADFRRTSLQRQVQYVWSQPE